MSHNKRAFTRTFVLLDKRTQAVPSKPYWDRLVTGGRVKEIIFTKNTTAVEIGDKIKNSFPSLASSDLNRLELIVSYSKGHCMQTVARGPLDGARLVELFGGVRKKKVFLYFSSVAHATSSSTSTCVAPALTQATITSTNSTPTSSSSSLISSSTVSATSTPTTSTSSSTSTTTSSTSTLTPITSTTTSSTSPASSTASSTIPSTASSMASSTASSTASFTASSTASSTTSSSITSTPPAMPAQISGGTMLIDLTTPPTGGASTQRYLTALASATGSSSDMYADISPDESDDDVIDNGIEIVESCGQNNIDIQDPLIYGYVTDDFTTAGVVSDDHTICSRTSEVLQCLEGLKDWDWETAIPPFLTHTFEEICWQAYDDRRAIVLLLLNHSSQGQHRATIQSVLQKLQDQNEVNFYFWVAENTSEAGKRVVEKYGKKVEDQILFLVPSTQQTPVFVDCIYGPALKDFNCARLCQRIGTKIQRMSMEREQREQWRQLRREQEKELEQMAVTTQHHITERATTNVREEEKEQLTKSTKEKEENAIREARLARVSQEPTEGHSIRVRTPVGVLTRMFGVGSHYQEVYDWVGSQNEMPLHFTLHSCRSSNKDAVILHQCSILADETVNLTERDEQEVTKALKDQVSFKGNYPELDDMSKTVVDEVDKQSSEEEKEGYRQDTDGGNTRQKRKRKDKRAPKDRRKKQKKEIKH